jgi:hypothetical protein
MAAILRCAAARRAEGKTLWAPWSEADLRTPWMTAAPAEPDAHRDGNASVTHASASPSPPSLNSAETSPMQVRQAQCDRPVPQTP